MSVLVNHNTSAFAELAIRSLFANNSDYPLDLVVYDNDSNDADLADLADLQALTRSLGVPFTASGRDLLHWRCRGTPKRERAKTRPIGSPTSVPSTRPSRDCAINDG